MNGGGGGYILVGWIFPAIFYSIFILLYSHFMFVFPFFAAAADITTRGTRRGR